MVLEVAALLWGFRVEGVTPVPDVGGRLWRMTYERNGAELVWLERPDPVKTFVVSFKTLPGDDTGVAHIIEHSVLSGSERYPVKSPFDEMRKSSLSVFMNAVTTGDQTYYPFSTRNDRDFLNLADVYLDAVFHPTSVRNPLAFWQEGWHYEVDGAGNLGYNGVVYNEMKGAFADPERQALREAMRGLYPDTVYRYESGGWPEAIPDLTYEAYRDFYRAHYHPSNARIFLDGSVDLPSVLAKLDAVLGNFDRSEGVPAIPYQPAVTCRKAVAYTASGDTQKTVLVDAWSVGTYRDRVRLLALDVLSDYLAGSNESPLKRALLARNLCEDVCLYGMPYQQLPLVLVVRNTTDAQAEACRAVVRETLADLVAKGLDRTRLRAIIDLAEFNERELNTSLPRGLVHFSRASRQWLYGGDPAAAFDLTGLFGALRQGVDSGLFESVLREQVLDNPHHVELTCSPRRDAGEAVRRTAAALRRRRAALTDEELAGLRRDQAALEAYQRRRNTPGELAALPALGREDIPATNRLVAHTVAADGAVTRFRPRPTSDGVVYLSAYFPLDGLSAEELPSVPLFASLLGDLATRRRAALDLQTACAARMGRLSFSAVARERGNYLCAEMACLAANDAEAFALLKEILLETRFDDTASVGETLRQMRLDAERGVRMRGSSLAQRYALRGLSRLGASQDLLNGYAQVRWLQGAQADAALAQRYAALARRIFVRDGLVLSVTDNLSPQAESVLRTWVPAAEAPRAARTDLAAGASALSGLNAGGDTGFAGLAAALPASCPYDGALCVAGEVLSLGYLQQEVREKGGAYGVFLGASPSGALLGATYRDPTPQASLEVLRKVGPALRKAVRSEADLTRFIVTTVAGMDPYRPPAAEASRPVELYLRQRTAADEDRLRQQVLATTPADLARVADGLDEAMPAARTFVVGGDRQLQGLSEGTVEKL